jgi:hypothetical protein
VNRASVAGDCPLTAEISRPDVSELDVALLGVHPKDIERLVGGAPILAHDHAESLVDHGTGGQRALQVLGHLGSLRHPHVRRINAGSQRGSTGGLQRFDHCVEINVLVPGELTLCARRAARPAGIP